MAKIKLYIAKAQSSNSGAAKGTAENPYTEAEYEAMLNNGTWPGGYVQNLGYCMKEVVISSSYPGSSDDLEFSDDSWSSQDFGSSDFGSDPLDNSGDGGSTKPSGTGGSGNNNNGGNQGGNNNGGHSGGGTINPYPQKSWTISDTAWLYHLVENVGLRASFNYHCGVRISGYTMSIGVDVNPGSFDERQFWAVAVVVCNGNEKRYRLTYKNNPGYIYPAGRSVIGDTSFLLPESGTVTVDLYIGYNYDTGIGHTNNSKKVRIYQL